MCFRKWWAWSPSTCQTAASRRCTRARPPRPAWSGWWKRPPDLVRLAHIGRYGQGAAAFGFYFPGETGQFVRAPRDQSDRVFSGKPAGQSIAESGPYSYYGGASFDVCHTISPVATRLIRSTPMKHRPRGRWRRLLRKRPGWRALPRMLRGIEKVSVDGATIVADRVSKCN